MKFNPLHIILFFSLVYGCKNDRNLNGNYSTCDNGIYLEVYFKNDSMRVASESEWVRLSKWKKVEINNDTLFFETFGEWRQNWIAKINYIGKNRTVLHNLTTDRIVDLKRINEDLNFDNPKEFWNGFNNRKNSCTCEYSPRYLTPEISEESFGSKNN